jgi:hypothetical protein
MSPLRRLVVVVVVALMALVSGTGTSAAVGSAHGGSHHHGGGKPDFGRNVLIFDPGMKTSFIQRQVDAIRDKQIDDEMGTNRYALLFKPGTYGSATEPLIIQVGYYTEVAGLGLNPTDVTINGHVDVYNRCRPDPVTGAPNCIALDNFWRTVSNLTINVTGLDGCRSSGNFWAASQASPMRRVNITGGNLTLMDYCTDGPQYASGGFIADSKTGFVINGSQQQYIMRNSSVGGWSNGVWNQVFSGVEGAPAECFPQTSACGPYTTLAKTPGSREKPYLYIDAAGKYSVFVPAATTNSSGVSWENGPTPGRSIPLSKFFVAKPSDSVQAINNQLSRGMNLLLTPGVFKIGQTIKVKRADTVVLGMGLATMTAMNGAVVMDVADVQGVDLAGFTIDAGTKNSPVLMRVGKKSGRNHKSDPGNPTALQDVFFRIGGPNVGKADISLEVNSDNVILDDIWAWRADHGNAGTVGWDINTAKNGVIVNGDNVTATGFFVEHYQQHNVIWNGDGGKVVLFQNELAYDPPSQAAWMQAPGVNGWSALKVANSVKKFNGYGMGSYSFFNQGVDIFAENAYGVPTTLAPGSLHNMLTVFLDPAKGKGGITHVVNGIGGSSTIANPSTPVTVVDYPPLPDSTPPTVAITDNVTGATATGDVTFTFTFSEDVGTSFTTGDIGATGGTKGTFTRVDGTKATLVVAPATNSVGTIDISVAVGTFSDLAGNLNTAAATATQAYDTNPVVKTQMDLPVTFDSPTVAYGLLGFGGAEDSTVVVDPTDPGNKVAKVVKSATAELWAGTTLTADGALGFANRVPFTASATTMTVRVYSPDAGIKVRLKVEDAADPTKSVETEATTTTASAWETLTFDFANQAAGTAALNLAYTYNKASIFFNFGVTGAAAGAKTYYFDDVAFGGGAPPPPPGWSPITFDSSAVTYTLTGFGGAEDSTVVVDPTDPGNKVAKVVKSAAAELWAGTTVSTGPNVSVPTLPFTATNTTMTVRVYSPDTGIKVRLKVEDAADPTKSVETEATTTTASAWQTLTFDFANQAAGTAALNLAYTYNKASIFFNFGVTGATAGAKTYYFDDMAFPI